MTSIFHLFHMLEPVEPIEPTDAPTTEEPIPEGKSLACKAGVFWSAIHELFSEITLCRHLGR